VDELLAWLWRHVASVAGFALGLFLCLRLVRQRQRPSVTFAWLLVTLLVPYVGVPLYVLFGGRKLRGAFPARAGASPPVVPPAGVEGLLVREGQFAARDGNAIEWLLDGSSAYRRLFEELERAQRSIRVATFILARDATGRALVELLARKAAAGVEVHLLLDALGSLGARGRFLAPLRRAGGHVASFLPVLPLHRRWSANLRNHRKLAVIDGELGWTGGMNFAEEYLGAGPDAARWIDGSLFVRGPAVDDLLAVFAGDWRLATGADLPPLATPPGRARDAARAQGAERVQVVATGPDTQGDALSDAVLAAMVEARARIWLVTPYFIPDEALARALALQARLGRDVLLILPQKSNHRLADLARGKTLRDLAAAGVRVRCVPRRMLHAKAMVFDGALAVFGTANLDLRSLYLNFELSLFLHSAAEVRDLAAWMEALERDTVPLAREKPRFLERTLADFAALAAPLL